jgi:hypothetical protein
MEHRRICFEDDSPFIAKCALEKNNMIMDGLIDTGARGGNFIDINVALFLCEREGIIPLPLPRPKLVLGYDGAWDHRLHMPLMKPQNEKCDYSAQHK